MVHLTSSYLQRRRIDLGIINIDLAEGRRDLAKDRDLRLREKRKRLAKSFDGINYSSASVIAIDPGGTTGWSFMSINPVALHDRAEKVLDNIVTHQHGQLDSTMTEGSDIVEGEQICIDDLCHFIEMWPQAAVVIEDFVIRSNNRSREFLSPVRITSAIRHQMWQNGRKPFLQTPADAKTTCSDARLKDWGMYDSYGSLVHARDADRHALLFLRSAKESAEKRATAWPHLFGDRGLYTMNEEVEEDAS